MLDAMTPEEFQERWLANILDPIDDSWLQTGVIASEFRNAITIVLAAFGENKIDEHDLSKPSDFIPKLASRKRQAKTSRKNRNSHLLSVEASQAILRARFKKR